MEPPGCGLGALPRRPPFQPVLAARPHHRHLKGRLDVQYHGRGRVFDFTQQVLARGARDTPSKVQLKILDLAGLWEKRGEVRRGDGQERQAPSVAGPDVRPLLKSWPGRGWAVAEADRGASNSCPGSCDRELSLPSQRPPRSSQYRWSPCRAPPQ